MALKPIRQKSGKSVVAWATEQDIDESKIKSNLFE
jgi:predicted NUDIX family NTP pyrophosphohydrolase